MRTLCLLMLFALLFMACGEVSGVNIALSSSSSSFQPESSSSGTSSSSSGSFDINLDWVTLDGYKISRNLITQGQYDFVMGINPGSNTSPVSGVNWLDAMEFCERLFVSLPAVYEWENAAREEAIERNYDYWEWTSSCDGQLCLRKGLVNSIDSSYFTDKNLSYIPGGGYISFRVVKRN